MLVTLGITQSVGRGKGTMARSTIRQRRRNVLHRGHQTNKVDPQANGNVIFGKAGEYWLCGLRVKVNATDEWGGNFDFPGEKEPCAKINIGLRPETWWIVRDTLLHELLEFAFTWRKHRYHSDGELSGESSEGALFVFNHSQMAECIRQVANAFGVIESDLKPRWLKAKKQRNCADAK